MLRQRGDKSAKRQNKQSQLNCEREREIKTITINAGKNNSLITANFHTRRNFGIPGDMQQSFAAVVVLYDRLTLRRAAAEAGAG